MKGNVAVFTYLPKTGCRTIVFERPFFSDEEYTDLFQGVVAVFGKPDRIDVKRGISLSAERERPEPLKRIR